jgi:hypothetical protein
MPVGGQLRTDRTTGKHADHNITNAALAGASFRRARDVLATPDRSGTNARQAGWEAENFPEDPSAAGSPVPRNAPRVHDGAARWRRGAPTAPRCSVTATQCRLPTGSPYGCGAAVPAACDRVPRCRPWNAHRCSPASAAAGSAEPGATCISPAEAPPSAVIRASRSISAIKYRREMPRYPAARLEVSAPEYQRPDDQHGFPRRTRSHLSGALTCDLWRDWPYGRSQASGAGQAVASLANSLSMTTTTARGRQRPFGHLTKFPNADLTTIALRCP